MSDTIGYTGTAQGGSTTTLNDNSLIQANDFWNGYDIKFLSGQNIGLIRTVSDFDATNDRLTFSVALPFTVAFGDAYTLYLNTENQIVIVGGTGKTSTTENAGINPQTSAVIPDAVIEGAYKAQNALDSTHQLITDIVNARFNSATKEILDGFKLTQSGALNISGTQTTLLSSAVIGDSNIEVVNVVGFPTSGVLYLQGDTNWMRITYNNIVGNRLLGIPNSGTGSIIENASFTNQVLGGPGVIITPKGIVTINASGVETIIMEGEFGDVTTRGTIYATAGWFGNAVNGISIDSNGLTLMGTGYIRTAATGARITMDDGQLKMFGATGPYTVSLIEGLWTIRNTQINITGTPDYQTLNVVSTGTVAAVLSPVGIWNKGYGGALTIRGDNGTFPTLQIIQDHSSCSAIALLNVYDEPTEFFSVDWKGNTIIGLLSDPGKKYLHIKGDDDSDDDPGCLVLYTHAGVPYYLWVDRTGDLRIHTSAPTDENADGVVVGTQS